MAPKQSLKLGNREAASPRIVVGDQECERTPQEQGREFGLDELGGRERRIEHGPELGLRARVVGELANASPAVTDQRWAKYLHRFLAARLSEVLANGKGRA